MKSLRVILPAFLLAAPSLRAQVIDLTIHDVGLAIGDKPVMTGLRINFRDAHLETDHRREHHHLEPAETSRPVR